MCKKVLNEEHFPRKEEIIFNDERIKTSNQKMGNIIKIPKLPLRQKTKKLSFYFLRAPCVTASIGHPRLWSPGWLDLAKPGHGDAGSGCPIVKGDWLVIVASSRAKKRKR